MSSIPLSAQSQFDHHTSYAAATVTATVTVTVFAIITVTVTVAATVTVSVTNTATAIVTVTVTVTVAAAGAILGQVRIPALLRRVLWLSVAVVRAPCGGLSVHN